MIPRRRWPVRARDFAAWLKAPMGAAGKRAEADVRSLEGAFRDYLACSFVRATCSGRDALELALEAVGLAAGDEIVVPAYTLGELIPALQARGYKPVAADVDPDTFNIDVRSVEKHIGPRTRAVMALHLHGAPCDIEAICDLTRRRDIRVVEDCAHAMGASVGGRKVGTFGDAAFFSLEINKQVPTYGGGLVVLKDAEKSGPVETALAKRPFSRWPALIKALSYLKEEALVRGPLYGPLARLLFSRRFAALFERFYRRSHVKLRKKAAYSGFQARLGLEALRRLDDRNERLNRQWQRLAAGLPEGFVAQRRDRIGSPAFYNFVALSERIPPLELRQLLFRKGVDVGIGSEVMDDVGRLLGAEDCPVAAAVSPKAVMLPLYHGLTERRFNRVARALREVAAAHRAD